MAGQYITPLPQVAGRFDIDFIETAENFLNQLPTTCNEINTAIDDVNKWLGDKDEAYIKMYLGAKENDPTTRNDGSDLKAGDLYFNTTINKMRAYANSNDGWVLASSAVNGLLKSGRFTGDGSTKEFVIDGGYDANMGIVYLNGTEVTPDVDISDGSKIVFNTVPSNGDTIDYTMFGSFQLANAVDLTSSQTITGPKTFSKDITISDDMQGLILIDRSDTTKKYRLYVDNGNLGIETV